MAPDVHHAGGQPVLWVSLSEQEMRLRRLYYNFGPHPRFDCYHCSKMRMSTKQRKKKRAPVQSGRATLGTVIWFQQQKVGKCRSGLCPQRPSLLEGLASPWLPPLPLNTSNLNKDRSSHLAGSPSPPKTQKPCCFLCLESFPPFA